MNITRFLLLFAVLLVFCLALMAAMMAQYGYSLFVPKRLRAKLSSKSKVSDLGDLPLALISGEGEFRRQLSTLAKTANTDLNVRLECSSHSQVATAILSGKYAGFLPHFASRFLPENRIESIDIDGLNGLKRELVIAWNPKRAKLHPSIEEAVRALAH